MVMKSTFRFVVSLAAWLAMIAQATAQQTAGAAPSDDLSSAPQATVVDESSTAAPAADDSAWKKGRPITIQYFRPQDQRGINVFETTKAAGVDFTGFRLDFGAGFTSQLQNL